MPTSRTVIDLGELVICPGAGVIVGTSIDHCFVWDRSSRQLVQAIGFATSVAGRLVTATSLGRVCEVVIEAAPDDEGPTRPRFIRCYDVLTGVLRWRRLEKCFPSMQAYLLNDRRVIRVDAPQGAHLLDVDSGFRVRARENELVPVPKLKRASAAALHVPAAQFLPVHTRCRDMPGLSKSKNDEALDSARRAFFWGSAEPPSWVHREPSASVWRLIQELRRLEGKAPLDAVDDRFRGLELSPDVEVVFAAESPWLATHWGITRRSLRSHEVAAAEGSVPRGVRIFGRFDRSYLCAQPTPLGDRIGVFTGLGYFGPFPLESFLSMVIWDVVNARASSNDPGESLRAMTGYADRMGIT